jgi:hypothetical protein
MQYRIGAPPQPSKWPAKLARFFITVYFLGPWWLPRQYRESICLLAVSSGFWYSPGHAPLGDALRIAPADRLGHQNDRQTKDI